MSDDCVDDVGVTTTSTEVTTSEDNSTVTVSEETVTIAPSCDTITVETTPEVSTVIDLTSEAVTVTASEDVIIVETDCAQGIPGSPGVLQWVESTPYTTGDIIYYDGSFYQALSDNTNAQPDTSPLVWEPLLSSGAVDTVNGQTGVVVLDYTDVGADPAGSASTAETNANNYTDTEISNISPSLLPPGGNTYQRLQKASNADYDTQWAEDTYSQFVFDSMATQALNVFNNWSDLVTAINNGQSGQKTITFRRNGDTLPAGTWSLPNTTFAGNGFPPAAGGIIINLANGFKFAEVPSLKFESFIGFKSLSSQPIFTVSMLTSIFMKENTVFSATTSPFFQIDPGAFCIFIHDKGALFVNEGSQVVNVSDGGTFISAVIGGAVDMQADTVSGGTTAYWQMYVYNDSPSSDILNVSQPNYSGTFDTLKVAKASYVSYDNATSGLTAEDVQDAIDELSSMGGAVDSVNSQTGVVVLDTDDIADTATNRYTNDTDITRLANTSGTNTGDQTLNSLLPSQTGNDGKGLATDGTTAYWDTFLRAIDVDGFYRSNYQEVITVDTTITRGGSYLTFSSSSDPGTPMVVTLPDPGDFAGEEVFILNTPFGWTQVLGSIDGGTGVIVPPNTYVAYRSILLPPAFGGIWIWGSAQRAGTPYDLPDWYDGVSGSAVAEGKILGIFDPGDGFARPYWIDPPASVPNGTIVNDILVWNGTEYEAQQLIVGKATDSYALSDFEMDATTSYFGYEDSSGNWYIKEWTRSTDSFQFVKGASGYSTAWTNRASQTYASYEATF